MRFVISHVLVFSRRRTASQGDPSSFHKIEFEPPPVVAEDQTSAPNEDGFDVGSGESLLLALRGTGSDDNKEISSEPR